MMVFWDDLVRFIRLISRTRLNPPESAELLRLAERDLPWEQLVGIADLEGVAGLFYDNLKKFDLLGLLPKPCLNRLQSEFESARNRYLALLDEMACLSSGLGEARTQVMALQGLSLITTLYPDPGLRQLGDVDLMVKPGHEKQLEAILWQAGYRATDPVYPDLLSKGEILIDIHTHLLNLDRIKNRRYIFPKDLSPMWERAIPFFQESDAFLRPDPRDNLIALAAHILKHGYSRLIWLVDIHEWIIKWARTPEDWKGVVDRARSWRQERPVLYALILVEGIFDLQIPLWVKEGLGLHGLTLFEKHLLRLRLGGFRSKGLTLGLWLCSIEETSEKLKFLKETVFPRDEIMAQMFEETGASKGSRYAKRIQETVMILVSDFSRILTASYRRGGKR